MKIKVNLYGKTFSKNNIDVENEVIKKTNKFDWYFKYNHCVEASQYDDLNRVKEQIKKQYDCNERTITFNLSLTKATNN
jgi:hypothetical protein